MPREQAIAQLADQPLDVLVIGGGIVGAGIARDAAMRGLRVGLVDQADFASGTSSRSSRLLHGGLRYLAQGRIGLVRQSGRGKTVLRRIAPHLFQPLKFVFPAYNKSDWPLWKLRVGVKAYDFVCGHPKDERSESLDVPTITHGLPMLSTQDLAGGVSYFDALTFDARLVIDTLRSASWCGAAVVNYLRYEKSQRNGDLWRVRLGDVISSRDVEIASRWIVNAAGPWADRFAASRVKLRLTKGVHVLIDREKLPIDAAVVMPSGKRILFAIPWGEKIILGTTDTDFAGDPASVAADANDVKSILDVSNHVFAGVNLREAYVVATWAGVRPLLADPRGGPSDISRAHEILVGKDDWMDVAGGKLTTYRLMAEQAVDRIVKSLNRPAPPCETANVPLSEGDDAFGGVLPPEVSRNAVEHCCRDEWAMHLDDVMVRRTGWRYAHRDVRLADRVAEWMAACCGWDRRRTDDELHRYRAAVGIQLG